MFDASEVAALAADLDKTAHRAIPELAKAVTKAGKRLEEGWRANATTTAGAHGVHYPKAITSDFRFGLGQLVAEVGPEAGKPQGGMGPGFEYGSINQPPHLDGAHAADDEQPRFEKDIEDTGAQLLEDL